MGFPICFSKFKSHILVDEMGKKTLHFLMDQTHKGGAAVVDFFSPLTSQAAYLPAITNWQLTNQVSENGDVMGI
mgnify:CR=1 FL=1